MAHFAQLADDNTVLNVVVVDDSIASTEAEGVAFLVALTGHGKWKQTSYSANIRGNFAGIGYIYDEGRDAFIPPKPYASWTLDGSHKWQAPLPRPDYPATWDEVNLAWIPMPVADASE